jgi:hypothetical protein
MMSADWSVEGERLQAAMARALRERRALFLVEGIVLLIFGTLGVVVSTLATLAFTVGLALGDQRNIWGSLPRWGCGALSVSGGICLEYVGFCGWDSDDRVAGKRSYWCFSFSTVPRTVTYGSMGMAVRRRCV